MAEIEVVEGGQGQFCACPHFHGDRMGNHEMRACGKLADVTVSVPLKENGTGDYLIQRPGRVRRTPMCTPCSKAFDRSEGIRRIREQSPYQRRN